MKRNHLIGFAGIVLVGSLGLTSVASAAEEDGTGRRGRGDRPHLTDEQKCEYQDKIRERGATAQERLAARIEKVEARRADAEAEGNAELVARLDGALERLADWQARLDERLAGFDTWVVEHCEAEAPAPTE